MTLHLPNAQRTFGVISLALSCLTSAAFAQTPAPDYKILETFNVGDPVYVRALTMEPKTNTAWVGTSAGVHEIDLTSRKPRNTFTRSDGLANEYVFAVGIDSQGYKWFGTNAGGVSRYKDGNWKTYFPMHGLADYWIYSFANDKEGNLWIGTWAGVNHFNVKTGKFKTYVKELVNEWVYGLDVDAKGRTWFATEGGVSMFDGKTWKSWTHKDGLGAPNADQLPASSNTGLGTRSRHDLSTMERGDATYNPNYSFAMHIAPDGDAWVGTWGGGVARFNGTTWRNYNTKDGLVGNIVYSIARDDKGAFWFGTDKGVSRFDGKTWRSFTTQDGLLDSHVYTLTAAPNGDIWVGTRRGVAIIGKK
ncbi:ligand-binding sensor domain-containing protein [Aromatoleum diolicum]|uniref:Regulator n=1 Tax=Aromatoleum diolicum TaxID=75796 RepID=A0ABX1QCH0_9RHOO|nr:two-component regulator propeller domain-containing protein [Aromatoleum diolicum]NMG75720.1 regulator [Aromatoleum diolicum]